MLFLIQHCLQRCKRFLVGCICQCMRYIFLVHLRMFCMECRIVCKYLLSLNLISLSSIRRYTWHIDHYQYNINSFLDTFHRHLLLSNIPICMMRSYLIFDMYKQYSLNQCNYIGNIFFHWGHILEDIQDMLKLRYKKDFGNMSRWIDWVKFLQSIQCICLDLWNRKWHMMRNMRLNIWIYCLKEHNPRYNCYKFWLRCNRHN